MAGAVALCPVVVGNVQQVGDVYQLEIHAKALALRKKSVTHKAAQLTVCGPSGQAGTAVLPLVVLLLTE